MSAVPGRAMAGAARPRGWLVRAALLALAGINLALVGLWLAAGETYRELPVASMRPDGGHAYLLELPRPGLFHAWVADSNARPRRSRLVVTEDGRALGPAHAVHDEIRTLGAGRYSHYEGYLRLAASDDSDPRANGRRYVAGGPVAVAGWLAWSVLIADLVIGLLAYRAASPRARAWLRRYVTGRGAGLEWAAAGLVLAGMAGVNALILPAVMPYVCLAPDSGSYLDYSLIRTPGYVSVVKLVTWLGGGVAWLPAVQLNLMLASFAALGWAWRCASPRWWEGYLLAGAMTLCLPALMQSYQLLTEAVFTAMLGFTLALVLALLHRPGVGRAVAASLGAALAYLVRPVGIAWIAALALVPLAARGGRVRLALALAAPLLGVWLGVSALNGVLFGSFSTQQLGGIALAGQVAHLIEPRPGDDPVAVARRRLAERLAPEAGRLRALGWPTEHWRETTERYNVLLWSNIVPELNGLVSAREPGLTEAETGAAVNALAGQVALETIREQPRAFARHFAAHYYGLWRSMFLYYGSVREHTAMCLAGTRELVERAGDRFAAVLDPRAYLALAPAAPGESAATGLDRWWHDLALQRDAVIAAAFALTIAVLGALPFLGRVSSRVQFLVYASASLHGYLIVVALFQVALERYVVPVTPQVIAIAVGAVLVAFGALTERLVRRSAAVSRGGGGDAASNRRSAER